MADALRAGLHTFVCTSCALLFKYLPKRNMFPTNVIGRNETYFVSSFVLQNFEMMKSQWTSRNYYVMCIYFVICLCCGVPHPNYVTKCPKWFILSKLQIVRDQTAPDEEDGIYKPTPTPNSLIFSFLRTSQRSSTYTCDENLMGNYVLKHI
jgi:hypothetical protein